MAHQTWTLWQADVRGSALPDNARSRLFPGRILPNSRRVPVTEPRGTQSAGLEDFNAYRRPGPITLAWRWRTEIALTVALVGLEYLLSKLMGFITGALVIAAAAAVLCAVPPTRNWMVRRGWCLFTRHRLYGVFRETWTTTRMGRLSSYYAGLPNRSWGTGGVCGIRRYLGGAATQNKKGNS